MQKLLTVLFLFIAASNVTAQQATLTWKEAGTVEALPQRISGFHAGQLAAKHLIEAMRIIMLTNLIWVHWVQSV